MPRDPFPFPRFENDHTFTGTKHCQRLPFTKPTHLAQTDEPWSSLNDRATLSSIRRSVLYHDQQKAQKDSLDLHLSSVYDHHLNFLQNKNETLFQKDTLRNDFKCTRANDDGAPKSEVSTNEMRVWVNPQKASIYSTEGVIESHHNASTNRGYSRKHDGGFYS